MSLASIRNLATEDLESTNQFIIRELGSSVPMIGEIIEYVLSCGGKRVRPMMLLLSARALSYAGSQHIYLAAVIELIHTATLLHDDVVDSSTLRRGHQTAHTIWGSDASVLVGDFLYSRAFQLVVQFNFPRILNLFSQATHYIAEGEIMQLANRHNPDTTEEFYYNIIDRKTARLFEIATEIGALISTQSEDEITAMREYGRHLGLAYQLIDDALDYSQPAGETGKNIGQDLADGKATLPLIYAIKQSTGNDLAILRDSIKAGSTQDLETIQNIIESTHAIKYTADAAKHHIALAKKALSVIKVSPYRQALEDMCDFVVARTY